MKLFMALISMDSKNIAAIEDPRAWHWDQSALIWPSVYPMVVRQAVLMAPLQTVSVGEMVR